MEKSIDVLCPIVPAEEILSQKLKQYNRFRRTKVPESVEWFIMYKPYYYFEIDTKIQVVNKSKGSREHVLVDALSRVPSIVDCELEFLTLKGEELQDTVMQSRIQMEKGEEIAADLVAKSIYRKYRQFPQCQFNKKILIYRKFYVLKFGPGNYPSFPGDTYSLR